MSPGASSGRSIVGILLAGGRGTRFSADGSADKLLAAIGGRPVCVAAAQALRGALPRVVAAVGPDSHVLAQTLVDAGCQVVRCERASEGMGGTLADTIAQLASLEQAAGNPLPAWCVMPADMPWLRADTVAALRDAWLALPPGRRGQAVFAPSYREERGHPVLFGPDWTPQLAQLQGDEGARRIISGYLTLVPVEDEGCLRDVDTPADLAAGPTGLA